VTNCVRHSQSTPRSKKVRVFVRISAHSETSRSERTEERRAEGAQTGRIRRRVATKWEGDGAEK
jgi:hypothetical protein